MTDLARLTELAGIQKRLEKEILNAEDHLKDLKNKLLQVKHIDLPELMMELGIQSFKLEDGSQIFIKNDIKPYIRVEDRQEVYKWLKQNNHGAIIKSNVIASFKMGEDEIAEKAYKQLVSWGVDVTKEEDIHYQTLRKFVGECLQEGFELHEKIGINPIKESKIK